MKEIRFTSLFFLLFFSVLATSQNNSLKIGAGPGILPYEGTPGWGGELQYEHLLGKGFSAFASTGFILDHFGATGGSKGTDGNETWDNSWEYDYSERFQFIELGMRYRLFGIGERYFCKLGTGATLGQSVFKYPETLFIRRGIIEQRVDVTHRAEVLMVHFGIEQQFNISEHLFISLNAAYRTTFGEKHLLERKVTFENGFASSTSGIRNLPSLFLLFGYTFKKN